MGLWVRILRGKANMGAGVGIEWRGRGLAGALCLLGVLGACTPTHNWREVRHEGSPVKALLPCKPERADREVPLSGPDQPPVRLQMMSCDVQGRTYALAAMALPSEASNLQMPPSAALSQWRQATWASLRQTVPADATAPTGWALQPAPKPPVLEQWRGPALNHQGQPLQAEVVWLAAPGWLVQAAVYAPQVDAEALQVFFESVRLSP